MAGPRAGSTRWARVRGFRKVRKELGVSAFGVNAIVMPPGYATRAPPPRAPGGALLRPRRAGSRSASATTGLSLGPGDFVRVDPSTVRSLRNESPDADAVYVCIGGADGYVGRDGLLPEGETSPR